MKAKSVTVFVVLGSCTTWELHMSDAIFKISDWGFLNVKLTKPSFQGRIKGGVQGQVQRWSLAQTVCTHQETETKTKKDLFSYFSDGRELVQKVFGRGHEDSEADQESGAERRRSQMCLALLGIWTSKSNLRKTIGKR